MNALIAFHHVVLIDGTGREPLADATVAVRDRQIVYAGAAKTWQPSLQEDIINIDLPGKYLLPGLIDCHVHLAGNGRAGGSRDHGEGSAALGILRNARHCLASGFTTVRDVGGCNGIEFAVRAAIQKGDFSGPRLVLSGRCIARAGAFTDQSEATCLIADDEESIHKAARDQCGLGADTIVLLGSDSEYFESRQVAAAVQEAAKQGRKVAAVAHSAAAIRHAVQGGAFILEGGTRLSHSREAIEEMPRQGTVLVPELRAIQAVGGNSKGGVSVAEQAVGPQQEAEKSVRTAYKAGVPIAMGSDAYGARTYQGGNALEIDLLQKAGLTAMDALGAATLAAARALGRESDLGSIAEGKLADLLILDADPVQDLRRLADTKLIRAVFLDGKLVARQPSDAYPRTVLAKDCLTVGQ